MRDILIVLVMILAALGIGAALYVYGPPEFTQTPEPSGEEALPVTPVVSPTPTDVRVTVLDQGTNAGAASSRKNAAAYDTEAFKRLWQMAHGNDGTPLPAVDFTKEYVIGVFAGTRSSGGYSIEVSNVTDDAEARTVTITLTKPGPGCIQSQALTSPYQIVSVPLSGLPLSKEERTQETFCR